MNIDSIQQLAQQVLDGKLSIDRFVEAMSSPATARLAETSLDLDRTRRCGYPEVIYGEGKPADVLAEICRTLIEHGSDVLATRVDADKAALLLAHFPSHQFPTARYNAVGRTFRITNQPRELRGCVAIVTAGTSDLAVAEEARETVDWMGCETRMIHDVGVAGPHRLRERLGELANCGAVVVVAGMEGALPSVVGGYVPCPVIAVPTSVGYGASFGGVAALLGMLNSCAANVTVVNIDAGFKGGYVAGLIARQSVADQ